MSFEQTPKQAVKEKITIFISIILDDTSKAFSINKEHLNAVRNAIPSLLASSATFTVQETESMRPQSHLGLYMASFQKSGGSVVAEASHAEQTAGYWPRLVGVVPVTSSHRQNHRTPSGRDSAPLPFRTRARTLQPRPSEKSQPHGNDNNHKTQVTPVLRPPHRRV